MRTLSPLSALPMAWAISKTLTRDHSLGSFSYFGSSTIYGLTFDSVEICHIRTIRTRATFLPMSFCIILWEYILWKKSIFEVFSLYMSFEIGSISSKIIIPKQIPSTTRSQHPNKIQTRWFNVYYNALSHLSVKSHLFSLAQYSYTFE